MTIIKTHKISGWKRESIGWGNFRIIPADDSGERKVAFMSAGSWANLPDDSRAMQNINRVVLIDGAALPDWAMVWLNKANDKSCDSARENFDAMVNQADSDQWNRMSDSY